MIMLTQLPIHVSSVLTGLRFDVKSVVKTLENCHCTHMLATPTLIIDMLNDVEKNNVKLPHLQAVMMGGMPVPIEVAKRVTRLIPSAQDVRVGYGATETGPCMTASHLNDSLQAKIETVGSPLDFVEIKLVDANGQIVRHGDQGSNPC